MPIAFAALCGVMCERSGVVNIGIEGTMLVAAFVGWSAGVFLAADPRQRRRAGSSGPPRPCSSRCCSRSWPRVLVSAVHAWLSISVRADQIISGTIINIAAFGITGYLNTLLAKSSPTGAGAVHGMDAAGVT